MLRNRSPAAQNMCCLVELPTATKPFVSLMPGVLAQTLHVGIVELLSYDQHICPTLKDPTSAYCIIPAEGFTRAPFSRLDATLVARSLLGDAQDAFVEEFARSTPGELTLVQRYALGKAAAASPPIDLSGAEKAFVALASGLVGEEHKSDPLTSDAAESVPPALRGAYTVVAETYSLIFAGDGRAPPVPPPPPPTPPLLRPYVGLYLAISG